MSTTKQASADATAKKFGVPLAFDNATALLAHPEVELVVVSVKAPDHAALARAAVAAGKHVLVEWPVGVSLRETAELADLAKARGVHAFTMLQRRLSPSVQKLRQLLVEGYLGTLRSVHVHAVLPILGARRPAGWAFTADVANGTNTLHTVTAHMLDPILTVVGEPTSFAALVARQIETTTLEETGAVIPVTAPDQVAVIGTLAGGAVLSLRVEAGKRNGGGVTFTLTGTEGDLEIGAGMALRGARGDGQPLEAIAADARLPKNDLSDDAYEVAHLYGALAPALRGGALDPLVPTLDDGVRLKRMLEAFVESSTTGRRVDWTPRSR